MVLVERPNNSDLVFCREHRPGESRLPSSPKQPPSRTWAGWASGIRRGRGLSGREDPKFWEFVKSSTVPSHILGSFSSRMPPPSSRDRIAVDFIWFEFISDRSLSDSNRTKKLTDSNHIWNEDNWIKVISLRMIFGNAHFVKLWQTLMRLTNLQIFSHFPWSFQPSKSVSRSSNFLFSSLINVNISISIFEKGNWRFRNGSNYNKTSSFKLQNFFYAAWGKCRDFPRIKWHLSRLPLSPFPFVIS